jgi:hypothetical protein
MRTQFAKQNNQLVFEQAYHSSNFSSSVTKVHQYRDGLRDLTFHMQVFMVVSEGQSSRRAIFTNILHSMTAVGRRPSGNTSGSELLCIGW